MAKENVNEAFEIINPLLEKYPEDAVIVYEMAEIEYKQKEYEEAEKLYNKVLELLPDDYNASIYCDLPDYLYSDTEIKNCLYSGIFSGYEDMTVRPWNNLTRAEAAAVFVRLNNYISDKK